MPTYNKLVRDRIPDIIEQNGKILVKRVLSESEYAVEVKRKLTEELMEYAEAEEPSDRLEELADVLELIYAAAALEGTDAVMLEAIRARKAEQRGGFAKRIYLVEVQDD